MIESCMDNWSVEIVKRTVEMHRISANVGRTKPEESSCDELPDQRRITEGGVKESEVSEGQEAPGQAVTHYAPDVPCVVVSSICCIDGCKTSLRQESLLDHNDTLRLSLMDLSQHVVVLDFKGILMSSVMKIRGDDATPFLAYWDLSLSGDYAIAARNLFAALRWAEVQPSARWILISTIEEDTQNAMGNKKGVQGVSLKEGLEDRIFRATSGVSVDLHLFPTEESSQLH